MKQLSILSLCIGSLILSCNVKQKRTVCDELLGTWKAGDGSTVIISKNYESYSIKENFAKGGIRETSYIGDDPCGQYEYNTSKEAIHSPSEPNGDWYYRVK